MVICRCGYIPLTWPDELCPILSISGDVELSRRATNASEDHVDLTTFDDRQIDKLTQPRERYCNWFLQHDAL